MVRREGKGERRQRTHGQRGGERDEGDGWAGREGEKGRGWVKGSPGVHTGDFCLNPKTNRKLPERVSRFDVR